MITIAGLTTQYGSVRAVDDLTFDVRPGKVTGFLGPNGLPQARVDAVVGQVGLGAASRRRVRGSGNVLSGLRHSGRAARDSESR